MVFSIIIPTYNRVNHLPKAIVSVLEQTFSDWELIIVDDGSTDNTKELIETYKDPRIIYIYQENAERSVARNNGINNSKCDWICFLDSDDEFAPDHLRLIADLIRQEKLQPSLISTGLFQRNESIEIKKPLLSLSNNIIKEITKKFLIPVQVCVHRSILKDEQFDKRFRLWEDTHLWLRIAAQYPVYQIEEYTTIQNIHNTGTVIEGMKNIKLKDVNQYVFAILDLRDNYTDLFEGKFSKTEFNKYINSKFRMYLYQSRQNKQIGIAMNIWVKAFVHKPSYYLLTEFPKIFLNKMNIGIHG